LGIDSRNLFSFVLEGLEKWRLFVSLDHFPGLLKTQQSSPNIQNLLEVPNIQQPKPKPDIEHPVTNNQYPITKALWN